MLESISNINTNQETQDIIPISITENIAGNYDIYIQSTLSQMIKFIKINELPPLLKHSLSSLSSQNKKILLLDLDETLIHAEFIEDNDNNSYDENIYDTVLSFYTEIPINISNINDNNTTDDESKDDSDTCESEKELNKIGIFFRPKLKEFLEEISEKFFVGIFTASIPEYADTIINYLDPDEKYIKFRLYRNDCVLINNSLRVKDLKILGENINLKNVVLLDNNIYSFLPQINNGILINSFFGDKNDDELSNVMRYLLDYILPCDDVRKINDTFFGFEKIMKNLENKAKNNRL